MPFGMFQRQGQSRISKRWGQTNEIIAELANYHHFHSLTACNIYGIMVLVRFIVVFVWEAFALWSHLLKHIAHPLECIMEMKSLLLCFFLIYALIWQVVFFLCGCCVFMCVVFFLHGEERKSRAGERRREGGIEKEKKKTRYGSLFKVRAAWNLWRSTYYRQTFQRKIGPVYLLRTTC